MQAGSPAETLDRIREGGTALIALARGAIQEAERFLDEGRFHDANTMLSEAQQRLQALAAAEHYVGSFAHVVIKKAVDLEVGDDVQGYGILKGVDVEVHHEGTIHEHKEVVFRTDRGHRESVGGLSSIAVLVQGDPGDDRR